MHKDKKPGVEVSVMGQKFQIKSDTDEAYVHEVAAFVNDRIEKVIQRTKSVPSLNVVLLAAMNIADEHMKFKRKKGDNYKYLEKKVEDLIELIDLHL